MCLEILVETKILNSDNCFDLRDFCSHSLLFHCLLIRQPFTQMNPFKPKLKNIYIKNLYPALDQFFTLGLGSCLLNPPPPPGNMQITQHHVFSNLGRYLIFQRVQCALLFLFPPTTKLNYNWIRFITKYISYFQNKRIKFNELFDC